MLTPGEFYALMDLEVMIEADQDVVENLRMQSDLVAIVDAEFELVCLAPRGKAATLAKLLNASQALVERP